MTKGASINKLKMLPPNSISPNPENPRLIFRQEEMDSLLRSIDKHGIQVPVTVYVDKNGYYLLDGERRWRCASKLNLESIPAIIKEKPTELQNLVLMYNIHALREQWDYYTIASKLERVILLFEQENNASPNERDLSALTGLTVGAIRRCNALLGLPDRFKITLMDELEKPKSQQRLSEDFFIEMERSLKAVTKRMPKYSKDIDEIRDTLVAKYVDRRIEAVTDFRQLSKIATAVDNLGVAHKKAEKAVDRLFDPSTKTGIKDAYAQAVEFVYDERRAFRDIASLREFVEEVIEENKEKEIDEELLEELKVLQKQLKKIISKAA